MVLYLIRKYVVAFASLTLILSFFPIFFGQPILEVVPSALFWAGLFAAFYIYRRFLRLNLWALYDNLRLSRWWLLGTLAGTAVIFSRLLARIL